MISTKTNRLRAAVIALGAACLLTPAANAQDLPTSVDRPGETLSAHLRMLAENPESLTALMGAGRAALDLGDAQAALTFFGRAEELAPSDGRIKMWMGSALVQMEQPATALKFFDDARRLGVPEADLARDRGLAHDMSGNPAMAQHDYKLVLAKGPDPEVTRRLALSLAIAGKKDPALAMLEDQLRRQDRAAWRTRAFVLALSGDVEGANQAAQAVMPIAQAAAMRPFLARLAALNPAERAMAVHFGRIAGDGRQSLAAASPSPTVPPAAAPVTGVTEAGRPDSRQPVLGQTAESSSGRTRTTRERYRGVAAAAVSRRDDSRSVPAPAQPTAAPPAQTSRSAVSPTPSQARPQAPVETARNEAQSPAPSRPAPTPAPLSARAENAASGVQGPPRPTDLPPSSVAAPSAGQGLSVRPETPATPTADARPAPIARSEPQTRPQPAAPGAKASAALPAGLTDIAAALANLRDEPRTSSRRREADQSSTEPAPKAKRASAAATTSKAKPQRAAARIWVQVATGASKASLPREFARLKTKAPALLGKREAWTTPLNATNRLLVGPFDSDREAQTFINALGKADVSAFSWTSPAGQEIEKLPAK